MGSARGPPLRGRGQGGQESTRESRVAPRDRNQGQTGAAPRWKRSFILLRTRSDHHQSTAGSRRPFRRLQAGRSRGAVRERPASGGLGAWSRARGRAAATRASRRWGDRGAVGIGGVAVRVRSSWSTPAARSFLLVASALSRDLPRAPGVFSLDNTSLGPTLGCVRLFGPTQKGICPRNLMWLCAV